MVQELAPLHKHVRVAIVWGDGLRADHGGGDKTRKWQREAVVPSLSGATWEIEAIVIDGLEQALEGSERGAPHGVLQVVTSAIVSAILLVEADVRAIVDASMGSAARQVSYHIQETRGHQVIVAVGCKIERKEWVSCKV